MFLSLAHGDIGNKGSCMGILKASRESLRDDVPDSEEALDAEEEDEFDS